MITLAGYEVQEKIYESSSTEIYSGVRASDRQPVIFKILKDEFPSLDKLTNFLHEYEILKLLNGDGTVVTYGLEKYKNNLIIISEKCGESLHNILLSKPKLKLSQSLSLAISIVNCLDKIHKHHIIHKDITPSNILWDKEKDKITIIDFGISSTLPKETLRVFSINKLEGTLAYLSPEQTGRMNRGIDYRSDYYSLGITLYHMFTGTLPFKANDSLEYVHSHIAKIAIPPHEIDLSIPVQISKIIMKLMAKTPEERYQSSYGIISDLETCLIENQKQGTINEFPLGRKDLSVVFQIPEKLYGREAEINFLLDTFDIVTSGLSKLILIAGDSGIGKSSLVHEIYKPIVKKRGYFVTGKFDQLRRNTPYGFFLQAIEELVQELLTEKQSQIKLWKNRINEALGPNIGVITAVLPSLVKIIGKKPPVNETGSMTETENRFILAFQSFIKVLATKKHPLVIFLDDLQWADLSSLNLLRALLADSSIKYLLIIGAYRSNEVNAAHPLLNSLEHFQKEGALLETIQLQPLQVGDVQQLLSDVLSQKPDQVQALATICYNKTLGNPFFLNQFLRLLYNEGDIYFDTRHSQWHWMIEEINKKAGTENVIDLVLNNFKKLSAETQIILPLASCLGRRFDLQMLSFLYNQSPKKTADVLVEAMHESFILPLSESYRYISDDSEVNTSYQFLHDRIQQAAYSLLDEDQKQRLHLKIGRHLLQKDSTAINSDIIFDITDQFNLGAHLILDPTEKIRVANLNLQAGKKANASAAFVAAYTYFQMGISLLQPNSWRTDYALTFDLYSETAETAYQNGDIDETKRLNDIMLKNARSVIDQSRTYEIKIHAYMSNNQPIEAVKSAIKILRILGVKFPENPNKFNFLMEMMKLKFLLMGKKEQELLSLPLMKDPYKIIANRIIASTQHAAYLTNPLLALLFGLALIKLSLRYGYTKETPVGFASYGVPLCGLMGEIDRGYEFGQIALKLIEIHPIAEMESTVIVWSVFMSAHWKQSLRKLLAILLTGYFRGIETGNLEHGILCAHMYTIFSLESGIELQKQKKENDKFLLFTQQHGHKVTLPYFSMVGQIIDNYLNLSSNPCEMTGAYGNELEILAGFKAGNNLAAILGFYYLKLPQNYIFYHYEDAFQIMNEIHKYIGSVVSMVYNVSINFYSSLTRLALYEQATIPAKAEHLKAVLQNQKILHKWAKFNPIDRLHKYYLVEAELARIKGENNLAAAYYDKAIQTAEEHEYTHECALACELAAKFYLASNRKTLAKFYLEEAYYYYTKWGAIAKLKHLESHYSTIFNIQEQTKSSSNMLHTYSDSTVLKTELLDLSSVLKASQAITREIVLANLLKKLMNLVIENAGAQKGHLLLKKNNHWVIEASAVNDNVKVLQSHSAHKKVPQSVINFVTRTNESVVLANATENNKFMSDPYIIKHSPKSLLCIPLLNQGILSGILYLENNLINSAFTEERVNLLKLLSSQIVISIDNARLYADLTDLNKAYEKFVPREFLSSLSKKSIIDVRLGDQVQKNMTVLFCDIRNFTARSEKITLEENFAFVNDFLSCLSPIINQYHGFIDKYIGDSIMAIFPITDDALSCSIAMLKALHIYNENNPNQLPISVGIGLNSGSLMLGIVGDQNHLEGTVISDAVNISSRVEELAKIYNVSLLITKETYQNLQNPEQYACRRLGNLPLKGKDNIVTVYEIFDNDPENVKLLKQRTKKDFEQSVDYFQEGHFEIAHEQFQELLHKNPADQPAAFYLQQCENALRKPSS